VVVANKMYSTMVTCLSEELTRIGLALRHLAPVEGIVVSPGLGDPCALKLFWISS
jgi:hypothetical protein